MKSVPSWELERASIQRICFVYQSYHLPSLVILSPASLKERCVLFPIVNYVFSKPCDASRLNFLVAYDTENAMCSLRFKVIDLRSL